MDLILTFRTIARAEANKHLEYNKVDLLAFPRVPLIAQEGKVIIY